MSIQPDLIQGTRYVEHEGDWSVGAYYDHPQYGRVKILAILQRWEGDRYKTELAAEIGERWTIISLW